MKHLYFLVATVWIVMLVGCTKPAKWHEDQDLREQLFFKCLEALPAGPQSTKYNDWDEVVNECGQQAYFLSRRCVENCQ